MNVEELAIANQKLEIVMAGINKQYGANSLLRYGNNNIVDWPAFQTGAPTLDAAVGIGGLPKGRVVEIYGPESSGKSTLCQSIVAEAQKQGEICAYIDAEHAVDPKYAKQIGVNMDDLLLSQPDYGEMGLEITIRLVKSGVVGVVVVDSVAGLTPKAELDGEMEDQQMGLLARMMSKNMRKLVGSARESGTLVIFTNQLREKIGVLFGNPETTPGGRALRFAASVRIDLRKVNDIKNPDGTLAGITTKAKIVKNKMAPPYQVAEFDIHYGRGIDYLGGIVDLAADRGVLTKSGAWFLYNGDTIGQGRLKTAENLANDMDLANLIKEKALAA